MTNNINLMKMLNELSYNQFKNDAKTSSKQQQMNKAVKAINHKIKEINKWKTKFEKKGHLRALCQPPMINVSFDKTDSKGKPKELFNGITTYSVYKSLQYQKVRFVSNCDVNDFIGMTESYEHFGFNRTVDIQLMDYSFYKILRLFGVPSVEPVAFANLKIKTPTKGYEGKIGRAHV